MKLSYKYGFTLLVFIITALSLFYYVSNDAELSPTDRVKRELQASPLTPQSVWSQKFLEENPSIKDKITRFENGRLCNSLKHLDTQKLTHTQILNKINQYGYKCILRPLAVNPKATPLKYLKIDQSTTDNPHDPEIAHQEICQDQRQLECVIRIKRDGFPLNKRLNPHSTKAVLLDEQGDPGSYDNEAFKISAIGKAVPKGPGRKFGIKQCPYKSDKEKCDQWVDAVMDEAHPSLKQPIANAQQRKTVIFLKQN